MKITTQLQTLVPKACAGLQTLCCQNNSVSIKKFVITCKKVNYSRVNRYKGYYGNLFTALKQITNPVIYWFEAANAIAAQNQVYLFKKYNGAPYTTYKGITSPRKRPPINSHNNGQGSKVLYVGKRVDGKNNKTQLTHIEDRIEMHLGYNPDGRNSGLQLVYWNTCQLTLNIIEFSPSMAPYLPILEQLFAIEFSPLIGRH